MAFLTQVACSGVAAAAQNQALNAVRFLYAEVFAQTLDDMHALRVRCGANVRAAERAEQIGALGGAVLPCPER